MQKWEQHQASVNHVIIYSMNKTSMSITVDKSLVDFVKDYQEKHKVRSKSQVVERALKALRQAQLIEEYKTSIKEWEANAEEAALWDGTVNDGLNDKAW